MARSVYVAGLGPGGGKSIVALGLAELLSRQVGADRCVPPLVPATGRTRSTLLRERYPVRARTPTFGVTAAEAAALVADGKREELISRIIERYRELERLRRRGGDRQRLRDGTTGPDECPRAGFNARLATEFGSVVVPVVDGAGRAVATRARVPLPGRTRRHRAGGDRQPGTGARCPACRCRRTSWNRAHCLNANRGSGHWCDWNSPDHDRIVVVRLLADGAAIPGSVEPVAGDVTLLPAVAVAPAAVPDSADHAAGFAPNVVAVEYAAVPDSVEHAGDFVPNVAVEPHAVIRDSPGAAVVRRAVERLAVVQPGAGPVEPAVAARALVVARSVEIPAPLVADLAQPDFPGDSLVALPCVPARDHVDLAHS